MMRETSSYVSNEFRLGLGVALDDLEDVRQALGGYRARRSIGDPAQDRVERRPQFVRERRQEFVLQTIGALRFVARRVQRDQHVAQLVLRVRARAGPREPC